MPDIVVDVRKSELENEILRDRVMKRRLARKVCDDKQRAERELGSDWQ